MNINITIIFKNKIILLRKWQGEKIYSKELFFFLWTWQGEKNNFFSPGESDKDNFFEPFK